MTLAPGETDDELLLRTQSGDEEAFLTLYRRRQAGLFRFALHMGGSRPVAEDVTQEVFLALLREDCGFDPSRGTLSGYLFGIARKLVLRHLERGRSDVALETEADDYAPPELAVVDDPLLDLTRREGIDALRRAVQALPRRYREVVVLCDLEEIDYADAAVALGCPIGTVRSRLHRARGLLLDKLNQERNPRQAMGTLKPVRCLL
ncbi:MAG: RNA polymerase sigma factor [Candidatus Solibacter sp.]